MAIPDILKRAGAWSLLAASIATLSTVPDARAQDVVSTPPELRDFRLDAPPPSPASESEKPAPSPAPQQDTPEIQNPPTPQATTASPAAKAGVPAPTVQSSERGSQAPAVELLPQSNSQPPVIAPPSDSEVPAQTVFPAPKRADETALSGNISPIDIAAGVALLLAMIVATWLIWRRRQRSSSAPAEKHNRRTIPTKPVTALPPKRPALSPHLPKVSLSPRLAMTMHFVPTRAVVSFSSLTIEGQLQISNFDIEAADHLVLHTILISASHVQQQAINSFFAHPEQFSPLTPIAPVGPGETVASALKLAIALSAMQTFSLQDKTLSAPILVARLARMSGDGPPQETARMVSMIGREADPPQAKMGPLRLDQGPRSFSHLGQRALVA